VSAERSPVHPSTTHMEGMVSRQGKGEGKGEGRVEGREEWRYLGNLVLLHLLEDKDGLDPLHLSVVLVGQLPHSPELGILDMQLIDLVLGLFVQHPVPRDIVRVLKPRLQAKGKMKEKGERRDDEATRPREEKRREDRDGAGDRVKGYGGMYVMRPGMGVIECIQHPISNIQYPNIQYPNIQYPNIQ